MAHHVRTRERFVPCCTESPEQSGQADNQSATKLGRVGAGQARRQFAPRGSFSLPAAEYDGGNRHPDL